MSTLPQRDIWSNENNDALFAKTALNTSCGFPNMTKIQLDIKH